MLPVPCIRAHLLTLLSFPGARCWCMEGESDGRGKRRQECKTRAEVEGQRRSRKHRKLCGVTASAFLYTPIATSTLSHHTASHRPGQQHKERETMRQVRGWMGQRGTAAGQRPCGWSSGHTGEWPVAMFGPTSSTTWGTPSMTRTTRANADD